MIILDRKQLGLLSSIVLLAALLGQACVPVEPGPMVAQTAAPVQEPAAPRRTFQLALNPGKTDLYPGEQIVISAVPLGTEQVAPNLQWSLEPAPDYGDLLYGELSSTTGQFVIYTAPDAFPVSVIVTAQRAETGEIDQIQFNIIGPP